MRLLWFIYHYLNLLLLLLIWTLLEQRLISGLRINFNLLKKLVLQRRWLLVHRIYILVKSFTKRWGDFLRRKWCYGLSKMVRFMSRSHLNCFPRQRIILESGFCAIHTWIKQCRFIPLYFKQWSNLIFQRNHSNFGLSWVRIASCKIRVILDRGWTWSILFLIQIPAKTKTFLFSLILKWMRNIFKMFLIAWLWWIRVVLLGKKRSLWLIGLEVEQAIWLKVEAKRRTLMKMIGEVDSGLSNILLTILISFMHTSLEHGILGLLSQESYRITKFHMIVKEMVLKVKKKLSIVACMTTSTI